jgi:hypothetical protein
MARSKFNTGKFISENPFISLIVVGGAFYGVTRIIKAVKKNKASVVEDSEKNPFNYVNFIKIAEDKAKTKKQTIVSFSTEEATKQAEKLHSTWNTFGLDYPEEAGIIIKNIPSKYDFAKVLTIYNNKYGYDYQAKIKDKYNTNNYDKVIGIANDLAIDYRIKK